VDRVESCGATTLHSPSDSARGLVMREADGHVVGHHEGGTDEHPLGPVQPAVPMVAGWREGHEGRALRAFPA